MPHVESIKPRPGHKNGAPGAERVIPALTVVERKTEESDLSNHHTGVALSTVLPDRVSGDASLDNIRECSGTR